MSAGPAKAIRILYVEDAFDQALVVKAMLQSHGEFDVTHSQDGDHAAKLLGGQVWNLIITDLNLPGLDGFELCRMAREANPDLPILAVTGYTGAQYHEQAFRAGATDLLTKPLEATDLIRKVNELLGAANADKRSIVLAVGGLVGDVEMGCGGALLTHRMANANVVIVPLCRDELDPTGYGLDGAREAAKILGAKIVVDELALDDTQRRVAVVEHLVRDLQPEVVYIPALDDTHPARRETFRIAKGAAKSVPALYAYQTATAGPNFSPTRFEDIGTVIKKKLKALKAFQEAGANRPDLSVNMAQAYAYYWGRLHGFTQVEPFEVLRAPE